MGAPDPRLLVQCARFPVRRNGNKKECLWQLKRIALMQSRKSDKPGGLAKRDHDRPRRS
jgi:hypothetical protein